MVIYRNFKYQQVFDDMAALLAGEEAQNDSYVCANKLIELASTYGFEGNLWHCFLAFCMANHENAYSTACEIVGEVQGSLNDLVMQDFRILKQLFDLDIRKLDRDGQGIWNSMAAYQPSNGNSKVYNKRIRDRIVKLAVSLEEAEDETVFKQVVTGFYKEFGVGKFGLNKAFRLEESDRDVNIDPIINVEHVYLKDIIGYQLQKQKLIENTEAFIKGKAANNALLYGDAGTGKSSCIKAILNEYYDQGLRIIEVYKHQFRMLSDVLEQVKDRNYKFIIYMDDLSFEDCESEYKYLKAIIEGGLGRKPKNVLIYATSNRRHLIREKFSDKREAQDELHENDTVQEKLSLAARFGVSIYFGAPDKKQFQNIVKTLAEKHNVVMPEEELLLEANRWELSHGGLSGRTASQFITHLLGKMEA
ncbi:DUF815 domain-containing protein [Clostridium sp. MCC353]|nr:DUF815 domain-containing protein [Clostridium sp. MCC353]